MKKLLNTGILLILVSFLWTGCDDVLNADSQRLTSEDEYRLSTSSDSIYAIYGLFAQLQKLGDSYVLLGELRGDLLDITESSDQSLREIYNFDISEGNEYVNIKNYYAVINNCNYILQYLDTNKVDRGQQMSLRHYAAVKSIRAWTYLQIALNYKTVKYYTHPILTVAEAERTYPEIELDALSDSLIQDLEPLKSVPLPSFGYIDSYNTDYSFFPVQFVLGDLYLWKGEYEKAASSYRDLMYQKRISIEKARSSTWVSVNNTISTNAVLNWQSSLATASGEVITTIACPTEYGQFFALDTLNNQQKIKPSAISINNWDKQVYYLNEASNSMGDLRKYGSISYSDETDAKLTSDLTFAGQKSNKNLIYKYKIYQQNITVYRSTLLYLRYAEAVNRMNKPNLAFAVLKYGLNSSNMFNANIVPANERSTPMPEYMSFSDVRFQNNVGVRMRGLGNMDKDTTFYRLSPQANLLDSVRMVEDLIQEELALETAYEGNRFHDLMRITLRRMKDGLNDDASYLADKVSMKYANKAAVRAKLLNTDNWYIKR